MATAPSTAPAAGLSPTVAGPLRIAAFLSHPIQYHTPLWQELATRPGVRLKVFYYSRHGLTPTIDPGFGVKVAWDVDLLAGYEHAFLPRRWPTRDPNDCTWRGLNRGITQALREGWDAVYISGYAHVNNWLALLAARRLGIPVFCHSDNNALTAGQRRRTVLAVKRVVIPWFVRRLGGCLGLGNHALDYWRQYGASPDRVFLLPCAVDTPRFKQTAARASSAERDALRAKYRIPSDKRLVLFCGKLAARKRPLDVVHALKKLSRDDVIGVFIGEGPLRGEIEETGGDSVVVTGFVNQKEIPLLLSLGTVLILPSENEPYGLVVTEAAAVSVPSLVSDRCGCYGPGGILRDGENGRVYRCGDVADLAAKLGEMLDEPQMLERMRRRCDQLAEEFSPRAIADMLLDAIRKVGRTARPASTRATS